MKWQKIVSLSLVGSVVSMGYGFASSSSSNAPAIGQLTMVDEQESSVSLVNENASSHERGGYERGGYRRGGYERGGYRRGGYERGGYRRGGYERGGYERGGYHGRYGFISLAPVGEVPSPIISLQANPQANS